MRTSLFTISLALAGCGAETDPSPAASDGLSSPDGLPVGFDRQAGYVSFDDQGVASFNVVRTVSPVLTFAGSNLDQRAIAYTSLQRLSVGAPRNRSEISLDASLALTLDDLVPSGDLVVERAGVATVISKEGEFATFAAWSPVDSNVIAYTYPLPEGEYGYSVVNTLDGSRVLEGRGDFSPDYLGWTDDGSAIGVFGASESIANDTAESDHAEFGSEPEYAFMLLDARSGERIWDRAPVLDGGMISPSEFDQGMEIKFANGARVETAEFMGGDEVDIVRDVGGRVSRKTIKAEQIRHRSKHGLVYVNSVGTLLELYAWRGDGERGEGEGEGEESDEIPVMSATSVTYYIPMPSGTSVTFTQVGYDYSGNGCGVGGVGVSSHYNGSGMDYAIDIQDGSSSYDEVIASAVGSTYTYVSTVSVNCGDASGCTGTDAYSSAYRSASTTYSSCLGGYYKCNSSSSSTGYGWGNYVILVHSDGYYTKYTHLESGSNFQVRTPACGIAAAAGCWLADEGHTGNTCGSVGGCGDHVHFQRQSSGSRSGTSVSVSFVEDSSITSADCVAKTPTLGGSSCSL